MAAVDAQASIETLLVCDRLLTSGIGQMLARRLRQSGDPTDADPFDPSCVRATMGALASYRGPTVLLLGSERRD